MEKILLEQELPIQELAQLGLYDHGKCLLQQEDIMALKMGRRTGLLQLNNLSGNGYQIRNISAKLSFNDQKLLLHPIYKEVQNMEDLNPADSDALINEKRDCIVKAVREANGQFVERVYEYDADTKEFISYAPSSVQAPQTVNNELLNQKQKDDFAKGNVVTISDGTRFKHTALSNKGILSDRKALILSVLLDGGISYLLIRGLNAINRKDSAQKEAETQGFNAALQMMANSANPEENAEVINLKNDHSRGYGRTSSR